MKIFLACIYVFLVLLGISLLFTAALKARRGNISVAKKMFITALLSIGVAMLMLFITGVVVSG